MRVSAVYYSTIFYIQINNIEPNEIKISGNESTLNLTIEVTA